MDLSNYNAEAPDMVAETLAMGIPVYVWDERCTNDRDMVRIYPDGKEEIVRLVDGQMTVIKAL
jgi:hypothetical protein